MAAFKRCLLAYTTIYITQQPLNISTSRYVRTISFLAVPRLDSLHPSSLKVFTVQSEKKYQTLSVAITSRDSQAQRALDMITETEADGTGKNSSQHQGCFSSCLEERNRIWVVYTCTENLLKTVYTFNIYSSAAMRPGSHWKPTIFLLPASTQPRLWGCLEYFKKSGRQV